MTVAARSVLVSLVLGLSAQPVWAKGLDELSDKSPEAQQHEGEGAGKDSGEDAAFDGAKKAESDLAIGEDKPDQVPLIYPALTQRLYLATSVGWAKASRDGGSWTASGMTDLTLGYRLWPVPTLANVAVTYRYAPTAVSGQVNAHSYRGVWEVHHLGGRFEHLLTPTWRLNASAEIGYLRAALRTTDGLPGENRAARSGAVFTAGLGVDALLLEGGVLAIGPRVLAGLGVARVNQYALSVGLTL